MHKLIPKWQQLPKKWNQSVLDFWFVIRLTHFHSGILFQEKFAIFVYILYFVFVGCLSYRYSVSKRTYAYMHVYVCVFAVFWIFFCFLFCCCRCCGVSMPLFLNTGEKLCFFLLLCVDSMSLVSHKMYTYIHAQSLNFIQFHSTMWNHHHHLYAIWWFVCEFLLTTDRELTAARTHTHALRIHFFSQSNGLLQLTHAAATFTRLNTYMSQPLFQARTFLCLFLLFYFKF